MASANALQNQLDRQRRRAEEDDAKRRAEQLKLPYLDVISAQTPMEIKALSAISRDEAAKSMVVPFQVNDKTLSVSVFNPARPDAKVILERLQKAYDTVRLFVSSQSGINHLLSYYEYIGGGEHEISGRVEIDQQHLTEMQSSVKSLEDLAKAIHEFRSPLTSHVLEIILGGSFALRASDIHLEPNEDTGALRFRIDGLLHEIVRDLPTHTYQAAVTRIKLLSMLKLNIHNEPQDGRFTISLADRDVEVRTSVIPSEFGETVVLRLLDPLALKVELASLGWRADDLAIAAAEIKKPNGLILNTGPTGSGKTTTLYAFLKYAWRPEIKIITIEDPIEYHLDGISQTQTNEDAHYNFASGLRSILRQDPNMILVGEIRDRETAEIAMNAALTGHIVFSTLHTNDAVGAVPRLIDLGVQPQVLGPALSLVIAQRLVRTLCPACKKPRALGAAELAAVSTFVGALPKRVDKTPYSSPAAFDSVGCVECGGLGYRGRISIFELFLVDENIEQAIYKNPTELELKALAKQQGMTTMQEDGALKALQGLTSFAEIERLTGPIPWLPETLRSKQV